MSKKILSFIISFALWLPIAVSALDNPIHSQYFDQLILNLLKALNPLISAFAIFFIVLAGYQFVTGQGQPEKIKQAQQTFLWTVVGLAIIFGAEIIINIIGDLLG